MASLASAARIAPTAALAPRRASRASRRASAAPVRAAAPAYDEVFDGNTGQMVKTLSQSVETVSAGGLDWSYRLGVPEEGVETKPNKVLLVHGAGLVSYTYSKLMRELQLKGYECYAPDMPGHGATSKPAPGGFKYDAAAYQGALDAFIAETGIAADEQIDLIVSGFFTSQVRAATSRAAPLALPRFLVSASAPAAPPRLDPQTDPTLPARARPRQAALLLAASKPETFRRVVVMNMPLANGHKLPDPLAVYSRPFGMGKGAKADVYKLAYFGNEFAIPDERVAEYEKPHAGADAEAARAALEATATADFKGLVASVTKAYQSRGGPKVRVVWGSADKYLNDAPMYNWCDEVRASFDVMRKVGHMPQEDFPEDAAKYAASFFESERKATALGSVRLGKIDKDDDYDRS